MNYALLVAATVFALAACNESPAVDAKDATPAEVAAKVRDSGAVASMISPGLWQSRITIEKYDMPGIPPEMAERMKHMMAENQRTDFQTCLTADDIKKPKEDFFAGKANECRYDHFTMGGGKIDALMRCNNRGHASTMRMTGIYSPDSYEMHMATEAQTGDVGAGAMQMQMRVNAKRVGQCPAKQN